MSELPAALRKAVEKYAVYMGDEHTLDLHERWQAIESGLAALLDAERNLAFFKDSHWKGPARERMEAELKAKSEAAQAVIYASMEALYSIEGLPPDARAASKILGDKAELISLRCRDYAQSFLVGVFPPDYPLRKYLFNAELNGTYNLNELVFLQFWFCRARHEYLEPIIENIAARRSARQTNPLNGGRRRDVGVGPLIQAATGAGFSMRDLAMILVGRDLDKKPVGSRAARIRREAKRLAEAQRTMKRASAALTPSAENL